MIQKSLTYSGMQSSKTPSIKPPLAAALASLEVQLDQELARYRRTRGIVKTASQSAASSTAGSTQSAIAFSSASATELPVEPKHQETPASQLNTLISPVVADPIPETKPEIPVTANSTTIVPTTIKAQPQDNSGESKKSATEPDDYLESSEALLRSLTEEQPKAEKKQNTSIFLSPLGIGSMLVLLASALLLAFVIANPKLFKFAQGSLGTGENMETNGSNQTVSEPTLTPIPRYPNLASEDFPEVKNPNDVVGLKPKPEPTAVVETNPVNPAVPPQPLQVVPANPEPLPAVIPTPTTAPPVAQSDVDIQPGADGLYHVVIDNSGDRAFAQARKAISDAYLSPDGKLIHLGAVTTKERAKQLVAELKGKGIEARIR
ncbi:SPOR domain-containing protein [Calothrix sp. PCC 6303]|uniref:SPOR domain-containing protein n=1 Tax=Calothrix sp. PCC 6303 TaxID=1170562 RepID=UPI0002A00957|nr:hypothetical protein [Calothrix sp. PCC 6303]AFZ01143.1 hypothetical protein Cal6303_2119 [Calothrix sp. PCC 6303]